MNPLDLDIELWLAYWGWFGFSKCQ